MHCTGISQCVPSKSTQRTYHQHCRIVDATTLACDEREHMSVSRPSSLPGVVHAALQCCHEGSAAAEPVAKLAHGDTGVKQIWCWWLGFHDGRKHHKLTGFKVNVLVARCWTRGSGDYVFIWL